MLSLLMLAGAVLADLEPMLACLVRGCIAMPFTVFHYVLLARPLINHATAAVLIPSRAARSSAHQQ